MKFPVSTSIMGTIFCSLAIGTFPVYGQELVCAPANPLCFTPSSPPLAPMSESTTKQEFSGTFNFVEGNDQAYPPSSEYSGFISYTDDGSLVDWEMNVPAISLFLTPIFSPERTVFNFNSPTNWDLFIDFGIAVDRPGYDLARDGSTLSFFGIPGGGLANNYFMYSDISSDFNSTPSINNVPEPMSIFGSLISLGFGIVWKKINKKQRSGIQP